MKGKKIRYCGTSLIILLIALCAIGYCPHKVTYTEVVKEATCFELGQTETICAKCDIVLESNSIEKIDHTFGDYEVKIKPNVLGPGLEVRVCSICLKEEKREYYCSHQVTHTEVVKEATCLELGQTETICAICDTVLESNSIEKNDHTFGDYEVKIKPNALEPGLEVRVCSVCLEEEKREYYCSHEFNSEGVWNYVKYATPFENGERYRYCYFCGAEIWENFIIPTLENNSIYITGTDIKNTFTISSFTQSAVDTYDIVYTEYTILGSNNPFILGHNYGSLGILYQTNVGEYIYLYMNGVIEIYEVVVSEYAVVTPSQDDFIGQTTGTSIWHTYDCKTLHMYTCYGSGRWIVLAKKIF